MRKTKSLRVTRLLRQFSVALAVVLTVGPLSACGGGVPSPGHTPPVTPTPVPIPVPNPPPKANTGAYELRLTGDEEVVIATSQYGLFDMPDAHVTFRRTQAGIDVWFAANRGTVHLEGTSFDTLAPRPRSGGNAVEVLRPSGSGFDKDYAGGASVITAANGTDLLMIYHAENYDCPGKTHAGIGLARSSDGGITWNRQGQIISGPEDPPCASARDFYGAGNPVVVMTRDGAYYYLYYVDFLSYQADEIRIARSPVGAGAIPGSWTKFYRGDFREPGLGGLSDPVIRRPSPENDTIFSGLPSVSYNLHLQRYLAVFTTATTFYYAASEDGLNWEQARRLDLPTPHAGMPADAPSYYYPSLLSLDQPTDGSTTGSAYLYFARGMGPFGVIPHFMERRQVQIVP
jgi:hypothetical protein